MFRLLKISSYYLLFQILKSAVDNVIQKFIDFIADVQILNDEVPTQIVVDLTAIEQTLNSFLSLQQKLV
jgi:predicted Zn-dependent protease with MMP-like domain